MTPQHLIDGNKAELIAQNILHQHGLITLRRNFRCHYGEIDLIMDDHGTLAFVEVRFRKNQDFGAPLTTVTRSKQEKIIKTAQVFLATQFFKQDVDCRFDIIALGATDNVWMKNAFTTTG